MPGRYELVGRGSDLGIRVTGPDLGCCLAAAVEGVAASLTEDTAGARPQPAEVAVEGDGPADLLVHLINEVILRLDTEGRLAVGLAVAEVSDTRMRGELQLVDLDALEIHGVAPKAATWHGVRLRPVDGCWEGEVMLDL